MKLYLYIISLLLIIQIVGAAENGTINITTTQTWKDQVLIFNGSINVRTNGHLTLDNTTIVFNQTDRNNYIYVYAPNNAALGGDITTKNNSIITVLDTNTMWTGIYIENAHANFTDTTFIRFNGSGRGSGDSGAGAGGGGGAIGMWETGQSDVRSSNFENVTFKDYGYNGFYGAISIENIFEPVNIRNSTFVGNKSMISGDDKTTIYYINPSTYNSVNNGVIENNILTDIVRGFMVNEGVHITLKNNTITNYTVPIDFFNHIKNSYYGYNTFKSLDPNRTIYSGIGCNIGCDNNTYEYNYVDMNNHSGGTSGFNYGSTNITFRNNIFVNGGYTLGSGSVNFGQNQRLFQVYNNTFIGKTGTVSQCAFCLGAIDTVVYNNLFKNFDGGSSTCINEKMSVWPDDTIDYRTTYYFPSNITFINNTCENVYYGFTLYNTTNVTVIDQQMINVSNSNVRLYGDNKNLKFINSQIDSSKLYFKENNDSFDNYYYTDILIQDMNGNPIAGATISAVNEVNSRYPSIDRTGTNRTTFSTGTNGHTKLPIGNDSYTVVLMAYSQNKT